MKILYKSKKCKTCKKILNNCIALRATSKKARNNYYCISEECAGENVGYLIMDDLIEFVEIREKETK